MKPANGSVERRPAQGSGAGNGVMVNFAQMESFTTNRLRVTPDADHQSECYDDLQLDYSPLLFSSLEKHLPSPVLSAPRESKIHYMRNILLRYSAEGERTRIQKHKDYRQKINANYPHLHREIYTLHAEKFFVPSFLKAIQEDTEESFRKIVKEPSPGIYAFEIFQPDFCQKLISEVENFERWVHETKFRIMRPNTMNQYGAVLDDFGLDKMLNKLMDDFIKPLTHVLFPEVGGSTLDSHHGFVVEYGINRDVELGFHVDDSEVTLNICLGKHFFGGDLFFRGVRCDEHVNSESQAGEVFTYSHVPGCAVLHSGRHRHGARATTSGNRINLILWCRSSAFRELKKYQSDFSSWCGECKRLKKERQRKSIAATKLELLKRGIRSTS